VDISNFTRKDIGNLGEKVAAEYLLRRDFSLVDRNVSRKTGEIDVIMRKQETLYFIEVKTVLCNEFPNANSTRDEYDPAMNLHPLKIRKVARTAEWYVANIDWEGEWQVDGVLVWMRSRDALCRVQYLPQIL
jgi:Holliday junction resolvase-like predicted endonuclease